jgi:hypothetical protein
MRRAVVCLALVASAGCTNPLTPGRLVDKPRVLGGRVEAVADPARASLHPGEAGRVTWLVGFPGDPESTAWAFVACRDAGALRGVPTCAGIPFFAVEGKSDPTELPSFEMTLPDASTLGPSDRVIVGGQICEGSTPYFDWTTMTGGCSSATAPGTTVDLGVAVGGAAGDNANPPALDQNLTFDGAPWPGLGVSTSPCTTVPTVTPGTPHEIALTVPAAAREVDARGVRETMQIAHLVTEGTLPAQFSFVEADDPPGDARVAVTWTAPAAGAPRDPLARFYVVLRDGRGGTSWAVRNACTP